jgi:hypothetical protein
MGKISEILANSNDDYCEYVDDTEIKEFLIEIGVASQFSRNPAGTSHTAQFVTLNNNPTHFILVCLYLGHEDKTQNGYRAWCLSKKDYTAETFLRFVRNFQSMTGRVSLESHTFKSGPDNALN